MHTNEHLPIHWQGFSESLCDSSAWCFSCEYFATKFCNRQAFEVTYPRKPLQKGSILQKITFRMGILQVLMTVRTYDPISKLYKLKLVEWSQNRKAGEWLPRVGSDTKVFQDNAPVSVLNDLGLKWWKSFNLGSLKRKCVYIWDLAKPVACLQIITKLW